jgi:hypothetical protein
MVQDEVSDDVVLRILSDEFVVKRMYSEIGEANRELDRVASRLLQAELQACEENKG